MDLQVFFQWHKLLHFVLPIVSILLLQKHISLVKLCGVLFLIGLVKEIFDTIKAKDPVWVSITDLVLSLTGILLGTMIVLLKNKRFH